MSTIDCHLKISKIKGESKHEGHADEIDVIGWGYAVTNPVNSSGGGMGQGKGKPVDISITMKYNKASPVLYKTCASGEHIDEISIINGVAGKKQHDFYIIVLKHCMITSQNVSANAGGEITESITVAYKEIEHKYKPQKNDGTLDGEVKAGWNIEKLTVS